MKNHHRFVLAGVCVLVHGFPASAQQVGFSLNRFHPSERGSEWFVLDSLDFRGDLRPAVGLVGDYAHRPLVLRAPSGDLGTPVQEQTQLHVGASLILIDTVRLAASVPALSLQSGDPVSLSGTAFPAPSKASVGDFRLAVDVRLLGEYRSPVSLALGGQFFVPSGESSQFSSDDAARGVFRLQAAGESGLFAWGAKVGPHLRRVPGGYFGTPIASEMLFAASVGVRLVEGKLLVGPELFASTELSRSHAVFASASTPVEVLLGGHYRVVEDVRAGLGVGTRLTEGLGAPNVRILASLEWAPGYAAPILPKKIGDEDGDGVKDTEDACPNVKGEKTGDPKTNGCPPPPPNDQDGDGVPDVQDACPNVKGEKTGDPKTNGCPAPPPDKDSDGVVDAEDACPDVKGEKTGDPKTNGCPPDPDRDKDGIANAEDACPEDKGDPDPDPKKHGCPNVVIRGEEIKIREQVKFGNGSSVILKESDGILSAVLAILKEHSEIQKVRVEGHTDNRGGDALNLKLSRERAEAVVDWLVKRGVAKTRLASKGFGKERPLDSNETDAGRKNNRRVEFHIEERKP